MNIAAESSRETEVQDFCKKIANKLRKYGHHPSVRVVLKELGREVLDDYEKWPEIRLSPARPRWFMKYRDRFRE